MIPMTRIPAPFPLAAALLGDTHALPATLMKSSIPYAADGHARRVLDFCVATKAPEGFIPGVLKK
jgi:hypothetical protein